ncbi:hypothetical protein [uncultured Methanobrevibacter sp.]|uniref:hypothetical protein n=1 Tax=uncultured Methanobrevibacter sp. TaxID=253161 RepID=UPI0025D82A7C|nr:hypothetical protein [uncultured Methanobrevibacter sp.]
MGNNVTLKNLNLINGNSSVGGATIGNKLMNFENVTFTNNHGEFGASIATSGDANINNCIFTNNHAARGDVYIEDKGLVNIKDSVFANMTGLTFSIIYAGENGGLNISDCAFVNSTAKYATAIYSERETIINGSYFINLNAKMTGGAVAFKGENYVIISDTEFINTSAEKNGGAIFSDISDGTIFMLNNVTIFNASGDFGGAICHLGGTLIISNSTLAQNTAEYDGGAIYIYQMQI